MGDEEVKRLRHKFEGMMEALFQQKGASLNISVLASDEAQGFIQEHASLLDSAFQRVEMSDAMRSRLTRSDYIFSGLKAFHELNEAFPSLLDENGERKTFERFLNDVQTIDETYNRHYLRAEYNFIHASAEMAAKWEGFMEDGDRYNLQYRTQRDDRVRPEHAALDGTTLPPSDPFWESYYPPNGWNCRCTVVQVRRSKYPATPHDEAMARGEEALQRDTKGIFRFNPGKEQKTMPDYNPYTIKRCRDCDVAKGKAKLARFTPENELCEACGLVRACVGDRNKKQRAIERMHYINKEMAPLLNMSVEKETENGNVIKVRFDKDGNKHIFSDTFGRSRVLTKEDLKDMAIILRNASYTGEADRDTSRSHSNPYEHFYYFEATLRGGRIRLNVGKLVRTNGNTGRRIIKYILYSVNDIQG